MSDAKKEYSSTVGMQASVDTSELLKVQWHIFINKLNIFVNIVITI